MAGMDIRIEARDGGVFGAYCAGSSGGGTGPGVIVLQEIFGVNSFVRQVVDGLADAGFLAIAPDLFWRLEPGVQLNPGVEADRGKAMDLMNRLDEMLAVDDITATMTYLRGRADCTGKVGAVGYCLGGKFAYLMATRTDIDATVGYYGVAIQNALDEGRNLRAKLLLHIAGIDHLCPPDAQDAIIRELEPRGARIEVYPGAGHGFARTGAPVFDETAAAKANSATMAFLQTGLAD